MLKRLSNFVRIHLAKHVAKVGFFSLLLAIVSAWVSYQDRTSDRHETAWATMRAAIIWTQSDQYRWGNVGQIAALQTLTRNCSSWWRGTIVQPLFELISPDCVDVSSLSLKRMELGGLKAAGANLSYSDFSCTNLAVADLRQTNLSGAKFQGSNLAGADFRAADLTGDIDLTLANVSWIKFDKSTKIDLEKLKCACLTQDTTASGRVDRHVNNYGNEALQIQDVLQRLNACPAERNTCEPSVKDKWTCLN